MCKYCIFLESLNRFFDFLTYLLLKMLCKSKIFLSADNLLSLTSDSSVKRPLRKLTLIMKRNLNAIKNYLSLKRYPKLSRFIFFLISKLGHGDYLEVLGGTLKKKIASFYKCIIFWKFHFCSTIKGAE